MSGADRTEHEGEELGAGGAGVYILSGFASVAQRSTMT
jgi:hypothetical protein